MNHPRAKLDNKRKSIIKKALKLYDVTELKKAIDGCANTPYHMGKNETGQIYDDINLILRDSDHIERFINNADLSSVITNKMESRDFMAGVI